MGRGVIGGKGWELTAEMVDDLGGVEHVNNVVFLQQVPQQVQTVHKDGLFSHILWVVTIIAAVTLAIVYGLVDNINLYRQAGNKNNELICTIG